MLSSCPQGCCPCARAGHMDVIIGHGSGHSHARTTWLLFSCWHGCSGRWMHCNTDALMVRACVLWPMHALVTRKFLWRGYGCSGQWAFQQKRKYDGQRREAAGNSSRSYLSFHPAFPGQRIEMPHAGERARTSYCRVPASGSTVAHAHNHAAPTSVAHPPEHVWRFSLHAPWWSHRTALSDLQSIPGWAV